MKFISSFVTQAKGSTSKRDSKSRSGSHEHAGASPSASGSIEI